MIELIPFKADLHADLLFKWRQQPDITRFMYSQKPISPKGHLKWADRVVNDPSHVQWVIEFRSRPVGAASLSGIDDENLRAEYGMYIADTGARLMGAGAAAEFLALDEAFYKLKLHKISSEVFATNEAPIRMHLRMGYVQEGILRQHARFENEWIDVHRLSILQKEWAEKRPSLKKLLGKLLTNAIDL